MELGNVEKKSIIYNTLRPYYRFLFNKVFYKEAVYNGLENIPEEGAVILAPNHQNALMDAMALVSSVKRTIVFLARSDIFSNKIVAKLLYLIKILPIYRIRDGKDKLKLNEIIFDKTMQILEQGKVLGIFPEAQHIDKFHLRNLKKGIPRIVFATAEKNNFDIDIKIVPVGMYYSNYQGFRSVIQVNFGKPISASEFYDLYKENKPKAMQELRAKMTVEIQKQMLDIRNLENHDSIVHICKICNRTIIKEMKLKKITQQKKFKANKKIIEITENLSTQKPEEFSKLQNDLATYQENLKKYNTTDKVISHKKINLALRLISLLLGFPVWLYGLVNNIIPALIPAKATRNLKDRQFESSIVYAVSSIIFPIMYLIQTTIFYLISGNGYLSLAYLISLPLTGIFAFEFTQYYRKMKNIIFLKKNLRNKTVAQLQNQRKKIINKVVNLYKSAI